ncbi:MAG: (2Fe-2S)-binding protein, partial [Nitrospirota bacterium]
AVANYRGTKLPEPEEGEIVCKCFGVTDKKIRRAIIENNLKTVEDITNFTKAGGGCGECIPEIEKILKDVLDEKTVKQTVKPKKKLTNIQKIAMIQDIMEKEIKPLLQSHGGDVKLIDVDGNKVIVSLRGMCTECLMADVTIKDIEKKLKELVSKELVVETE